MSQDAATSSLSTQPRYRQQRGKPAAGGSRHHAVPQRDADLVPLRTKVLRAPHDKARRSAQAALDAEVARRRKVDDVAEAMAAQLVMLPGASDVLLTNLGWSHAEVMQPVAGSAGEFLKSFCVAGASLRLQCLYCHWQLQHHSSWVWRSRHSASMLLARSSPALILQLLLAAAYILKCTGCFLPVPHAANELQPTPRFVKELVSGRMGRPAPGKPLVDSWDCLRGMVAAWSDACGPMDQYSMRHTRMFANLCNAGVREEALAEVAARVCGGSQLAAAAPLV